MSIHAERAAFTIIEGDQTVSLSYGEVYERVLGVADYLVSKGISKGDRIVLNGKNSPQWAIAYLGILFIRAIMVPLDYQMIIDRVEALSSFSEASGIFADRDVIDRLQGGSWIHGRQVIVVQDKPSAGAYEHFVEILESNTDTIAERIPESDDIAAILYTSGTTGNEKGVVLTHANFVSDVYQGGDPQFRAITKVTVLDKPMAMTSTKKIQRTKVSRTIDRLRGLS